MSELSQQKGFYCHCHPVNNIIDHATPLPQGLSDRQKSKVCEALAVNEFRLLDGASEYLQLVDLCAILMKTIADGP